MTAEFWIGIAIGMTVVGAAIGIALAATSAGGWRKKVERQDRECESDCECRRQAIESVIDVNGRLALLVEQLGGKIVALHDPQLEAIRIRAAAENQSRAAPPPPRVHRIDDDEFAILAENT